MTFAGTVDDVERPFDRDVGTESVAVHRRRRYAKLVTTCVLTVLTATMLSACSGWAATQNPESIKVEGVRAIQEIPLHGSYVAPDGSAWIYHNDDELCSGRQAEPEAEPTCAPWDRSLSQAGVSWSNDAKRVLFTEDNFVMFDESDVSVFDIETGRIDVLTDDSVYDFTEAPADADPDVDVLPFYGPGEVVYFFRLTSDEGTTLYRIVDGNPEPVDGGKLGEDPLLYGVPHPWSENTWVYPYYEVGKRVRFAALVFDGAGADATVSVRRLRWSPKESESLVDWRGGTAVFTPRDFADNNAAIVARPDERASATLPVDDQAIRDGFLGGVVTVSPDGKHVLELRDDGDGTVRCTVWRINSDDGSLSVEPIEVGTVTDERLDGGLAPIPGGVGWDGGTTLTAISFNGVVVFDVTTG